MTRILYAPFMLPLVPSMRSGLIVKRIGQPSKDRFEIIDIPFIATPYAIPSRCTL